MSKTSRVSFITAEDKRKRLDGIAGAFGKNLSAVINEALDNYIELHEWQLEHIRRGVEAARKGEFATDAEVEDFFEKHSKTS